MFFSLAAKFLKHSESAARLLPIIRKFLHTHRSEGTAHESVHLLVVGLVIVLQIVAVGEDLGVLPWASVEELILELRQTNALLVLANLKPEIKRMRKKIKVKGKPRSCPGRSSTADSRLSARRTCRPRLRRRLCGTTHVGCGRRSAHSEQFHGIRQRLLDDE